MFLLWLLRFLRGTVRFRAAGGFPERLLNLAARAKLPLWDIERTELGLEAACLARQYRRLRPLAKKAGMRLKLAAKRGAPFTLRRYRARVGIPAGLLVFFLLLQFFSAHIWSVSVEGNENISAADIQAVVAPMGVRIGANQAALDIPTIQLTALARLPGAAWVAVNIRGSVAHVEIRERTPLPTVQDDQPSNITALIDGEIVAMTVYSGQAKVKVGDAVAAGSLLVSGVVQTTGGYEQLPNGALLRRASADILARTRHVIEMRVALSETVSLPTGRVVSRPTVHFFGFPIPLYTSSTVTGDYTLSTQECPLMANGVALPLSMTYQRYTLFAPRTVIRTPEQAAAAAAFQLAQWESNMQVESAAYTGQLEGDTYVLTGTYTCIEEIGVEQPLLFQ